jgi:hypothetical protein
LDHDSSSYGFQPSWDHKHHAQLIDWDGVPITFYLSCSQIMILSISTCWVAGPFQLFKFIHEIFQMST